MHILGEEITRLRDQLAQTKAELAQARAELAICRPLVKIIQRARFRLGGRTDTTTDCDEQALRLNAEAALTLLRETEAQVRAVWEKIDHAKS